jgi:mannose-6-phosphate isomerase-like protein (cupin superfamily)
LRIFHHLSLFLIQKALIYGGFFNFKTQFFMQLDAAKTLKLLPTVDGKLFLETFRKGNFSIEIYKPNKVDLQQPHSQDEIYVIISGTGMFQNGEEHYAFKANDLIFVPAFVEHRFYDFSDDFCTWVVFV